MLPSYYCPGLFLFLDLDYPFLALAVMDPYQNNPNVETARPPIVNGFNILSVLPKNTIADQIVKTRLKTLAIACVVGVLTLERKPNDDKLYEACMKPESMTYDSYSIPYILPIKL